MDIRIVEESKLKMETGTKELKAHQRLGGGVFESVLVADHLIQF
jgi:hypothetical protein